MGHAEKGHAEKGSEKEKEKGRTDKVEFLATLDTQRAADYLARIAEGFRKGTLNLSAGGRTISLTPTSMVKIELEAESKEAGRGSLDLEISWKEAYVAAAEALEISVEPREEVVAAQRSQE